MPTKTDKDYIEKSLDGILNKSYAIERAQKQHLKFRYTSRAVIAAWAIKKYTDRRGPLHLVDFGSADGLSLNEMAYRLREGDFLGIEYNKELISHYESSSLHANIKLIQGDVNHLDDIKAELTDVVTALALFEHLKTPQLAFKEAFRILKPGGLLIATSPSPLWDRIAETLLPSKRLGRHNHLSDMTKAEMLMLGEAAGFQYVDYFTFMWVPVGLAPYFNIPISANAAWALDRLINKMKVFNWSFANQCIVLKKANVNNH